MMHLKKSFFGNYTSMLHAVLNKSWKQHPTKQLLYDHLIPISQAIIDGQNMLNSKTKFLCGFPGVDTPVLANYLRFTFVSSGQALDADKMTYWEWWTQGTDYKSQASLCYQCDLVIYIYIYIYIYI